MRNSLEIDQLHHGYVVRMMCEHEDGFDLEDYALERSLDVLAEVMRWLGYGERVAKVLGQLQDLE
jgi:hypothetical protein